MLPPIELVSVLAGGVGGLERRAGAVHPDQPQNEARLVRHALPAHDGGDRGLRAQASVQDLKRIMDGTQTMHPEPDGDYVFVSDWQETWCGSTTTRPRAGHDHRRLRDIDRRLLGARHPRGGRTRMDTTGVPRPQGGRGAPIRLWRTCQSQPIGSLATTTSSMKSWASPTLSGPDPAPSSNSLKPPAGEVT